MSVKPAPHLYINLWRSGLYTQRSPLVTPMTSQGLQIVQRFDVLIDGLNVEQSNSNTLVRRPGFPKYCSTQFGSSDYPLAFYSFQNLSGTIKLLVDTPTKVATFDTSSITQLFSKGTTQQTSFQKVASTVYMCNGTDSKKWDGTTVSGWGIAAPSTAPTLGFTSGTLSPTSGYKYVYVYKNNSTGHISTASSASGSSGPLTSKTITVSGSRSTDAQVDKVDIYRTADGGSVYYYVTTISNPPSGSWSYADTTTDANLVSTLVAPINHANDPPPSGIGLVTFHMGRLWVAATNYVYFAGGPDTTNGVPEEAFPPANYFKFPGAVTAMVSTSSGLLVFTSDAVFVIRGTDSASFFSQPWMKNFGVKSQNSVAQDGDLVFIYTSKSQLFQIGDSLEEIGFAIGDKLLANFSPSNTYLALHRSGSDTGLFLSDGSTNIYKYSISNSAWSPVTQPVGGIKAIASIEATTANFLLLAGRAAGSGYILKRDTSTFMDDGSTFSAYATIGSIVLAQPGDLAQLQSVLIERMPVGTDATVSVMLNEINGSFTALPNPVADPPNLAGTAYESTTVIAKRHYLKAAASPLPQQVRHLQIKVAFASEAAKNELLGLALSD